MLSREELIRLSEQSIDEIDKSTLKELTEIKKDPSHSVEERYKSFIEQIGNPFHFLVNGTPVHISYTNNGKTLHDCLYDYFIHKKNYDT